MPRELTAVAFGPASIEPFRDLMDAPEWDRFAATMRDASQALANRTIWNVNSTAHGGGVAEMLGWEIPYERGVGIDARWLVMEASPAFFEFTKRLHTLLHGVADDGADISDAERREYDRTMGVNLAALANQVHAGDVVIVHDPQPAGLIPELARRRCVVIWRCHIGIDTPNDVARAGWRFLLPYVGAAHGTVFSRQAYVWEGLDPSRVTIIPLAIDAFAPKNQDLPAAAVGSILAATGILAKRASDGEPSFRSRDGQPSHVQRPTKLVPAQAVADDAALIVQVSRWDRLKDPMGVMEGFATFVAPHTNAHLILAGPNLTSVVDDPEQTAVFGELERRRQKCPAAIRERVHLALLPTEDGDENAAIVNALQRRADVAVQKSLHEGFGLTVAEAMWKARPVVASKVGGIQDQIEDGKSGVLIDDPKDLESFGTAVRRLLADPALANRLGEAARLRVRREFLAPRLIMQQAQLIQRLLQSGD